MTTRGNRGQAIFEDAHDRNLFSMRLAQSVELFGWRIHAYVQMDNHYHLLVETPEPNLSAGMHRLNSLH